MSCLAAGNSAGQIFLLILYNQSKIIGRLINSADHV